MRSCASRGARSPGSARNRSSCSRSDVGRGRAGMVEAVGRSAAGSTGEGRRQDVVALGGKDGAAAGIGRGVLGAEIGPGLEVLDGIDEDRKSTRLNSSDQCATRIPSYASKT